jgi:LCP family protein required for cell wall assembly
MVVLSSPSAKESAMTTYAVPDTGPRRPEPGAARPPTKRPKKRRDPVWAKLCLIFGSLVMVFSGAAVVLPKVIANWAAGDIPKEKLLPPELIGENIDGPINLLLLGMDQRDGSTDPIRTDTIIIVHIPATHDQIYMVSIPRDTEVAIPDFPESNFTGFRTKINAAFAFANLKNGAPDPSTAGRQRGVKLTAMTINNLVPGGLRFNGVAIINFDGFKDILKVLGGVDICIDVETTSIHFDNKNVYHTQEITNVSQRKTYHPGCQHLADWEALDFARQRHFDNGDYTRQRHQQQLLMAIFKGLASKGTMTDIGKLTQLQKAAGDLLTLDLGGQSVENWVFTLKSLRPNNLVMIKTNGGKTDSLPNGNERLTADSMQLLKAVHDDRIFDFLSTHPDWVATDK